MSRSTTAAVPEFIAPHFIAQEIAWQSNEEADDAPVGATQCEQRENFNLKYARLTSPQKHFFVLLLESGTMRHRGSLRDVKVTNKTTEKNRILGLTSCMRLQSKMTEGKGSDSPVQYVSEKRSK